MINNRPHSCDANKMKYEFLYQKIRNSRCARDIRQMTDVCQEKERIIMQKHAISPTAFLTSSICADNCLAKCSQHPIESLLCLCVLACVLHKLLLLLIDDTYKKNNSSSLNSSYIIYLCIQIAFDRIRLS